MNIKIIAQNKLYSIQIQSRNSIVDACIDLGLDNAKIDIINSIAFRESSFRLNAFNYIDSSAGMFGETPIFVRDVSRISKKKYNYKDRYNLRKSIEMLKIYLDYYTDWNLRNVCIMWHRSRIRQENIDYYNLIISEIKIARN